ncbi:hypothetical protein F4777DRAFT_558497 [Nemania sp. FL0916]|nr:hypothetical protein F4777DRAFT_558497 [Nemania sp. FL0916]
MKMEINLPNLLNTAFPDRNLQNRNAIILSENDGGGSSSSSHHHHQSSSSSTTMNTTNNGSSQQQNFLSQDFPPSVRKVFLTAESSDFDASSLAAWRAEGFEASYFGLGDVRRSEYNATLSNLAARANLGPCETFALIAYGEAAALALEYFHTMGNNPDYKLGCLVAYYPPRVPDVRSVFPGGLRVLVHAAGEEIGVVMRSQIVGIQGKQRVVGRALRGAGVGGRALVGDAMCAFPCYWYKAPAGFAEGDLDEYDAIAADLAWSRSLDTVRKALGVEMEVEGAVEKNLEGKFFQRNLEQTMSTYTTHKPPHSTYFPTLSGGIGAQELRRFYADYFLLANPDSTKLTLLSRTVGADRVVDELHVAFKHTQEMPWILPGVPPTNKRVEVAVVSIVTLRGGKLYHEHVYWDQASVLVQVGLLDPKLVPEKAKAKGVKQLPVVGREAARRLVHGFEDSDDDEGEADNELLPGWYDDEEEEGDDGAKNGPKDDKRQVTEEKEVEKQGEKEPPAPDEGREEEKEQEEKQEEESQTST